MGAKTEADHLSHPNELNNRGLYEMLDATDNLVLAESEVIGVKVESSDRLTAVISCDPSRAMVDSTNAGEGDCFIPHTIAVETKRIPNRSPRYTTSVQGFFNGVPVSFTIERHGRLNPVFPKYQGFSPEVDDQQGTYNVIHGIYAFRSAQIIIDRKNAELASQSRNSTEQRQLGLNA